MDYRNTYPITVMPDYIQPMLDLANQLDSSGFSGAPEGVLDNGRGFGGPYMLLKRGCALERATVT
jgi:hypothetical protein